MTASNGFGFVASRFLLCLATAIAVWATAYLCAWFNYRNTVYLKTAQSLTWKDLEVLRQNIDHERETTGKLPERLTDLQVVKNQRVKVDQAGQAVDHWGRPFHYQVEDGGYKLYSFGRDGEPGGTGQDADLYAGSEPPEVERPALWEFTTMQETVPVHSAAILAALFAFPICLINARGEPGKRPSLLQVLVANLVIAIFTIFGSMVIAAIHLVPGGH